MDFSYLNSISGGDKEFIVEFIGAIETSTLPLVGEMMEQFSEGNHKRVGELAHQVKPTIVMLGLEGIKTIEAINEDPESATEEMIQQVKGELEQGIDQIRANYAV
ncbi:hypothetical protein [Marinoscillum sp. MHG1-6]|uniref:hypothetical protein n=1 Tax=Marinoscillum sp. MHG1-6 TaxID=2959627 RepID=UPI002157B992|nr:hypothetical protein [Marinoscillum sp. MHG1-6]